MKYLTVIQIFLWKNKNKVGYTYSYIVLMNFIYWVTRVGRKYHENLHENALYYDKSTLQWVGIAELYFGDE